MKRIELNKMPNEYRDLYSFLINNYYYSNHKKIIIEKEISNDHLKIEYLKYSDTNIRLKVYFNNSQIVIIEYIRGGFANKLMYAKNIENNENYFNLKFIKSLHEIMIQELEYLKNYKFSNSDILKSIEKIANEEF